MPLGGSSRRASRAPRDPLQVNLRWVVYLILLLVIVPTTVLTGAGIIVLMQYRNVPGLVLGAMITSFSASVIAGALLLIAVARRGARLAQVQETFLSRMSHELLTPLSGIRLHTQMLGGLRLSPEASESVAAIQNEAQRLQALVERIVTWRKFRSTRHLYRRSRTTIGWIVEEVLRRVPAAAAVQVRVIKPDEVVQGDPEALSEAVGNLLTNALKYAGQDGPIELTARRLQRMIVFTVSDRGPGLPPGSAERIFEPFERVVPEDRPDPGGSGLGLTISRQIVRAHGGKLAVGRRRGPGLTFYIVLPGGAS